MTRVYFCARFGRRDELRSYRAALMADALGRRYEVRSSWLDVAGGLSADGVELVSEDGTRPERDAAYARRAADADLAEVIASDLLIAFTDGAAGRGGRHVELGVALALGIGVVVVGPREHIFHSAGGVLEVVPDWAACVGWLASEIAERAR